MASRTIEMRPHQRHSSRSRAGNKHRTLLITTLRPPWVRQFIDMGHCRLKKCTDRIRKATSQQLAYIGPNTFMAMTISAASAYGAHKEGLLVDYANVLFERGLDPDDIHEGRSAVNLAAYHGYVRLLETLLQFGAVLDNGEENAVKACIRNGKHGALRLLVSKRRAEVSKLLVQEANQGSSGHDPLLAAIMKNDIESVQILRTLVDFAMLSDRAVCFLRDNRGTRNFEAILKALHPSVNDIRSWSKVLHWSFPKSDRETLNWLWHTLRNTSVPNTMPEEIWLRVFSFVGRGWWTSDPSSASLCNVVSWNII